MIAGIGSAPSPLLLCTPTLIFPACLRVGDGEGESLLGAAGICQKLRLWGRTTWACSSPKISGGTLTPPTIDPGPWPIPHSACEAEGRGACRELGTGHGPELVRMKY